MIDFLPSFYNRDNFCDFLFALLYTKSFQKGSTLKGNTLKGEVNSLLLK